MQIYTLDYDIMCLPSILFLISVLFLPTKVRPENLSYPPNVSLLVPSLPRNIFVCIYSVRFTLSKPEVTPAAR